MRVEEGQGLSFLTARVKLSPPSHSLFEPVCISAVCDWHRARSAVRALETEMEPHRSQSLTTSSRA